MVALAQMATDKKKYDEAIADFSTAIELMPRSALSYRHRAIAQLKKIRTEYLK